ncbi:unnamed protein product [Linum trigynum]|uniref:Uncharacterized protein n=1 Tax=Linum trigynum TaxID=586398 RepID=A0AAV2CB32_9ROSI
METTFHYVIQHERQVAKPNLEAQVDLVALLDANQSKGKKNAKVCLFCRYCKKDNHVIADCYKLKRKNKEQGGISGFARQVQGVDSSGYEILSKPETRNASESGDNFTNIRLSNDDLSRLQKLLNQFSPPASPTSPVSPAPTPNSINQQQSSMVNSVSRHLSVNPNSSGKYTLSTYFLKHPMEFSSV